MNIGILITIVCALFFFTIYGIGSWFFPSEEYSLLLYAMLQIFAVWVVLKNYKKVPVISKTRRGSVSRNTSVIAFVIIIPFIFYLPLTVGLPASITLFFVPNETVITTIHPIKRTTRKCPNRIYFDGISNFIKTHLCVDESIINDYKDGDQVELLINNNIMGIRIYSFKKYG